MPMGQRRTGQRVGSDAAGPFPADVGAPYGFSPSPRTTRWFCGDCGGKLYMTDAEGRSVGVLLGSLDGARAIAPTVHGWRAARLPWLDTTDDLPRYDEDRLAVQRRLEKSLALRRANALRNVAH